MAWRPYENLIDGELDNRTPGKVTGWMLAFAKEAHPTGNLSWGTVVEFSVDKVFIRSPSHTVWGFVYPGPCTRRVSDRIQGRQSVFRRREGVDAATCTVSRIRPLPPLCPRQPDCQSQPAVGYTR